MEGEAMFFGLIGILLSFLVANMGSKRKIGFGWSLALSIFFSPLIGLIITLFSKKKDSTEFINIKKEDE